MRPSDLNSQILHPLSPNISAHPVLPASDIEMLAGTPATSVSKALNGWRRTSRTRSWLLSTLSTLSRTTALVSSFFSLIILIRTESTFEKLVQGGGHHDLDKCKRLVVEHFANMHMMAMEKFFIPTEVTLWPKENN